MTTRDWLEPLLYFMHIPAVVLGIWGGWKIAEWCDK